MSAFAYLFSPESRLTKALRESADPGLLWELFRRRVPRWNGPVAETEYGTLPIFGDLGTISPENASKLIPMACEILIAQTDKTSIAIAFSLLTQLAKSSDAHSLPPFLAQNWNQVELKALFFDSPYKHYWEELRWWYRSSPLVVSVGQRIPSEWVYWEEPYSFETAAQYIRETAFDMDKWCKIEAPWQLQGLETLRAIALEGDILYKYSVDRVSLSDPGTSGWVLTREGHIVGSFVEAHCNVMGT